MESTRTHSGLFKGERSPITYIVILIRNQEPALACQSFSTATRPSILRALPALEFMQEKWETMAKIEKYKPVVKGLENGLANLGKWYRNMDDTDIYFISLILDPGIKMEYFKTHWDRDYLDKGTRTLNAVASIYT